MLRFLIEHTVNLWFVSSEYMCMVWSNDQFEKYIWYPVDPSQLVETNIFSHWVALKPLSTINWPDFWNQVDDVQSYRVQSPLLEEIVSYQLFLSYQMIWWRGNKLITEGLHRRIFRVIELFCVKLEYWLQDSMHLSKPIENELYCRQNSKYQPQCQGILTWNTDGGI